MKRFERALLAAAIAAGSIQVAGCGVVPSSPAPPLARAEAAQEPVSLGILQADAMAEIKEQHERAMAALGLSETQLAQLKAIKVRYHGLFPRGEMKATLKQLKALMEAPELNQDAAMASIEGLLAACKARIPVFAMKLGEIRDVLTPEQRSKLSNLLIVNQDEMLELMNDWREKGFAAMTKGLELNQSQAAGLEVVKAADKEKDEARHTVALQAVAKFMTDGDQLSLKGALASAVGANAGKESIAWAATLSQDQRELLVANTGKYLADLKKTLKAFHRAKMAQPS